MAYCLGNIDVALRLVPVGLSLVRQTDPAYYRVKHGDVPHY